jgi:hypothetical protein
MFLTAITVNFITGPTTWMDRCPISGAGYATVSFGVWRPGNMQGRLPNGQRFVPRYGTPRTTDDIMTVVPSCLRPAPDSLSHSRVA